MSSRALRWGVAGLLCLLAALPWLREGLQWPVTVVALVDHCTVPMCDYTGIYLPQARVLLTRPGLVRSEWMYPPLLAILLQPLVKLGPVGARWGWLAVELTAALGVAGFSAGQLKARLGWAAPPVAVAMVSLSLPVVHTMKWGQVSLPIALAVIATLKWRRSAAGALLGVAAAVKVYPLAFLLGPLLQRRFRTVAVAIVVAVLAGVALPIALLGESARPFFESVARSGHSGLVSAPGGQALVPTLVRWFVDGRHVGLQQGASPLLFSMPGHVVHWLGGALGLAGVGLVAARLLRRRDLPPGEAAALVLVSLSLVLSPGWHHYFCFLPFAQAVALGRAGPTRPGGILALVAWGVTAAPLLLLTDVAGAYFLYSAWGGTTVAALLTLGALLWPQPSSAAAGSVEA